MVKEVRSTSETFLRVYLNQVSGGACGKESTYQYRRGKSCGYHPWRRKWQPTPVFLPGKCHGQKSLAGYSPRGCKESTPPSRRGSVSSSLEL